MLNIIIATKNPVWEKLNLCLTSIASLESADKIKVIFVYSGSLCDINIGITARFEDFVLCEMDAQGVYAAYNRGLDFIKDGYVFFMGDDDIVLPGLDSVISNIIEDQIDVDLIGCKSYMQLTEKLSTLPVFKIMVLWKNWCHQCCLYNSNLFDDERFAVQYQIQADHAFNIMAISLKSRRWIHFPFLISYFTKGGISSNKNDLIFRDELPIIAKTYFGLIGYLFCLIRRFLSNIIKGRPTETRGNF